MQWMLLAVQAATLGATNYAVDAPMAPPAAPASFADEFEGRKVDQSIWRFDTSRNAAGWYNNEKQYYAADRPENTRIEDGVLVVEARREPLSKAKFPDWGGQAYSSAKLVTRQTLGYGFYEVRAKLPCGRGAWPAIWMVPEDASWPAGGEIDIMEMVGWDPNVIHATLHSGAFNHRLGTQRAEAGRDGLHRFSQLPARLEAGFDHHRRRRSCLYAGCERPAGRGSGMAVHQALSADPEPCRGRRLGRGEGHRRPQLPAAHGRRLCSLLEARQLIARRLDSGRTAPLSARRWVSSQRS